jgi:protoporphyrinogen oxidase
VKEPRTFHQWVRNRFGERLFAIFFKTYTEKVWGMSCDEISADWAAQRIRGLSLGVAVMDGMRRSLGLRRPEAAETSDAKTLIESFRYPRQGPGMMWEAAARKMQELGGRLLLGQKVAGLKYDAADALWTVTAQRPDGTLETFLSLNVLSSAPIRELMSLIEPRPSSLFRAQDLNYRDFLTVVLIGRRQWEVPDNWLYIHDPTVKVGRVQNFRAWSPAMIPDEVSTCLGLEYFCFEGDGLWAASDAELIALAKREIDSIGLMAEAEVTDACVVRQPKAYPVYDDAYARNVEEVRREIASRYPTLHLIGRNGMHKYNNQDHAMMTGLLTALNIIHRETLYDVWQVNEDARYVEAGVAGANAALASHRLVPRKAS